MKQYHDALRQIYQDGIDRDDRTGTGTRSLFGLQMRFDLQEGFPAVTTKKLAWKAVVSELLWFLEGSDDERRLAEIHYGKPREELIGKTTIWTANADAQGKKLGHENTDMVKQLGPVYGVQWRNFDYYNGSVSGIDQIEQLIEGIKSDPSGRRHILSAWNPILISEMALPPCHCFAQFFVHNGKLSCSMYQRSADMFLGVPFNIASYALLTHMIAQVCGLDVGELIMTFGDAHIYKNHFEQVNEQLVREPYTLPYLWLNYHVKNIDDFRMEHIALTNYVSHDTIKAPMAV